MSQRQAIWKKKTIRRGNRKKISNKESCYSAWDPNAPIFFDSEKEYCHIFNRKEGRKSVRFVVDEIKVETQLRLKGAYKFHFQETVYMEP